MDFDHEPEPRKPCIGVNTLCWIDGLMGTGSGGIPGVDMLNGFIPGNGFGRGGSMETCLGVGVSNPSIEVLLIFFFLKDVKSSY